MSQLALDDVLDAVADHTDDWWKATARQAVEALAATGEPFSAYDLELAGVPVPAHANQWGPVFRAAHKDGLIVRAGYAPSKRPTTRASAAAVWVGA